MTGLSVASGAGPGRACGSSRPAPLLAQPPFAFAGAGPGRAPPGRALPSLCGRGAGARRRGGRSPRPAVPRCVRPRCCCCPATLLRPRQLGPRRSGPARPGLAGPARGDGLVSPGGGGGRLGGLGPELRSRVARWGVLRLFLFMEKREQGPFPDAGQGCCVTVPPTRGRKEGRQKPSAVNGSDSGCVPVYRKSLLAGWLMSAGSDSTDSCAGGWCREFCSSAASFCWAREVSEGRKRQN